MIVQLETLHSIKPFYFPYVYYSYVVTYWGVLDGLFWFCGYERKYIEIEIFILEI
jgi:hypothetical protein